MRYGLVAKHKAIVCSRSGENVLFPGGCLNSATVIDSQPKSALVTIGDGISFAVLGDELTIDSAKKTRSKIM